jgi:hypothetical protein
MRHRLHAIRPLRSSAGSANSMVPDMLGLHSMWKLGLEIRDLSYRSIYNTGACAEVCLIKNTEYLLMVVIYDWYNSMPISIRIKRSRCIIGWEGAMPGMSRADRDCIHHPHHIFCVLLQESGLYILRSSNDNALLHVAVTQTKIKSAECDPLTKPLLTQFSVLACRVQIGYMVRCPKCCIVR